MWAFIHRFVATGPPLGGLALILWPWLSSAVHEAGHALAARRFGVGIAEFAVWAIGPTLVFRLGATRVLLGAGLARRRQAEGPLSWVTFDDPEPPGFSRRRAIAMYAAGPIAETAASCLLALAATQITSPVDRLVVLLVASLEVCVALMGLFSRKPGRDGDVIRRLLAVN